MNNTYSALPNYIKVIPASVLQVMDFYPLFFFYVFFNPDIGDKYSVFRQLEQPADKKPVGKKLSDLSSNTLALIYMLADPIILFTIFVPEPNPLWPLCQMTKRALRWSLQATDG